MELSHVEFWGMTPAEFEDRKAGYYRRRRAQLEDSAHFVCAIINSLPLRGKGAKTIRVENILGQSEDELRKLMMDRQRKRRKQMEEQAEDT